ncbi:MAG TPA: GlsB/YeaQ/YmgE family stress response membrane protein [Myxococcus sp.]|nr:GlsB/YeaQ/YmgE family stress response membrane protein [Myxococcus sp.]
MGGLIGFIVVGLIAGLIARAILPGRQSMGLLATMLLGMVGSFVGGLIGSLFRRDGRLFDLHPSGILMSVLGAIVVLLLVGAAGRRRIHA